MSRSDISLDVFPVHNPEVNNKQTLKMPRDAILRRIFKAGVDSVRPQSIFRHRDIVRVVDNKEIVVLNGAKRIQIDLPVRTHVVGFGKGVFGMALEMERILGEHLTSGQINVPVSEECPLTIAINTKHVSHLQTNSLKTNKCQLKTIKAIEASPNNLPDETAVKATQKIYDFAGTLTADDILFVLITGGGSALLPLPCRGVTLNDKLDVIQKLVRHGATINDLNEVRIQLSDIKGGKLAQAAKGAREIISLIISDIVRDPLELIASGPTVTRNHNNNGDVQSSEKVVDILKTHGVWKTLSDNVQQAVARANTMANADDHDSECRATNILIASNSLALDGCLREISRLKDTVFGVYLSNAVVGNVSQVAAGYFHLAKAIKTAMRNEGSQGLDAVAVKESLAKLSIHDAEGLFANLNEALLSGRDVCLVAGGETTVAVRGNGVGGRNQQMVLEFMKHCKDEGVAGVYLLSAGTDGIDGPTDAAGAVGSLGILREQFKEKEGKDIEKAIETNDSYHFFKSKPAHVVIGHTGTNVMDVQLLWIENDES